MLLFILPRFEVAFLFYSINTEHYFLVVAASKAAADYSIYDILPVLCTAIMFYTRTHIFTFIFLFSLFPPFIFLTNLLSDYFFIIIIIFSSYWLLTTLSILYMRTVINHSNLHIHTHSNKYVYTRLLEDEYFIEDFYYTK